MSDRGLYKPDVQKEIVRQAIELKGQSLNREALTQLKGVELKKIKGGHFINHYYKGMHDMLIKLFPEYRFHLLDFETQKASIPIELHKEIVQEMGRRMGFSRPEDWYLITYQDFDIHRTKSIRRRFNDSAFETVMSLFPEYGLEAHKFLGVSKTQERIFGILKCLYPNEQIHYNYKHSELLFSSSRRKMEIDIFFQN